MQHLSADPNQQLPDIEASTQLAPFCCHPPCGKFQEAAKIPMGLRSTPPGLNSSPDLASFSAVGETCERLSRAERRVERDEKWHETKSQPKNVARKKGLHGRQLRLLHWHLPLALRKAAQIRMGRTT